MNTKYTFILKKIEKNIHIMLFYLTLWLTLIDSNHPVSSIFSCFQILSVRANEVLLYFYHFFMALHYTWLMVCADLHCRCVTYITWSSAFALYFLPFYMDLHYTWVASLG